MTRQLLVLSIAIGVMFTAAAEGLQCYVCEDCNEYQDFKELHICGEISINVTQKPSTMPADVAVNASATVKPAPSVDTEEYVYDYSVETRDDSGLSSVKGGNTTAVTTVPITSPTTNNNVSQEVQGDTTVVPITTTVKTETISSSLKPSQLPEDYDYMEYEDPKMFNVNRQPKAANDSLLKIDEPVCYMYRYYENNTVFTNRGCTSLLNANKFLTCQALSNGTPMVGCRICSTDGCNKFDLDESGEDHLITAGVQRKHLEIVVAFLGIVISFFV